MICFEYSTTIGGGYWSSESHGN